MFFKDTAHRSFWSRPEIAELLLPAGRGGSSGKAAPSSPQDLASAISSVMSRLGPESREVGARARDSASALARDLAATEVEITSLKSAVDPAEVERLVAKLSDLGSHHPHEGAAKGQMRDMFQKQLDLLRGFESRLKGLRARSARQLELLRRLWLHVDELAASSTDGARLSRAAAGINALCAEIAGRFPGISANSPATEATSEAPTLERL
jgi:hypothetical protein